jgi:hypothetical protein
MFGLIKMEFLHSIKITTFRPFGVIYNGVGAGRPDVYLADLDGDKKCDYLVVSNTTGEVRMIKNGGLGADKKFTWIDKGVVFRAGACAPPNKIIFADLDADGMFPSLLFLIFRNISNESCR